MLSDESVSREGLVQVHFVDLEHLLRLCPQFGAEKFLDVESVAFVVVGKVAVQRVLGDVVLLAEERPHAAKLQYAGAAVHHRKLMNSLSRAFSPPKEIL